MILATGATWAICVLATVGVVGRPWQVPEWIWAVAGAALLVVFGFVPVGAAGQAVGKGLDVYLFLTGMMLLSATARANGVFDWVAATAVNTAKGSRPRLFALIYLVGVVVTTFLSNDATAVVLTPAVYAAAKKAEAEPLPLLFACALIANAASFVLPISNPANLVLYGGHMPPLTAAVAQVLARGAAEGAGLAGAAAGAVLAVVSNLMNNLPAGLVASDAVKLAHAPKPVIDGLLIAIDLGPNLSITGSLATILWLQAIRREGEDVSFWQFLKVGLVAMPVALIAALGARLLV